jgi:hypothetical protein
VAAALLLAACGPRADQRDTAVRPAIPAHFPEDGLAISDAAHLAAFTVWQRPPNELLLVDTRTGALSKIVADPADIMLMDPAFDRAGRRLAFVARPPNYFGVGKLVIYDLADSSWRVFGDRFRNYGHPTFSFDGKTLYYFRDVDIPVHKPNALPPRMRENLTWGLFARNLQDGTERQLDTQVFRSATALFYSDDGLYFEALEPVERLSLDTSTDPGRGLWGSSPVFSKELLERNLLKRFEEPLPHPPKTFLPASLGDKRGARLSGVCAGGRTLYAEGETGPHPPYGYRSYGLVYQGGAMTEAFTPPAQGAQRIACSPDGASFAGTREPGPSRPASELRLVLKTAEDRDVRILDPYGPVERTVTIKGIAFDEWP